MKYAACVRKTFSGKFRLGVKLGFADGNKSWPLGSVAFNNCSAVESTPAAVKQSSGAGGGPQPGLKFVLSTAASVAALRSAPSPNGTAVREVPISRSEV